MVEDCKRIIKEILNEKEECFTIKLSHKNTKEVSTRYCKHNDFDILFCGSNFISYDVNISFVYQIDGSSLIKSKIVSSLTKNRGFGRNCTPAIYLKGYIYLFDCLYKEFSNIKQVEKYSILNDSLISVGEMLDDYDYYCACGFIDKIYFLGGRIQREQTATCRYFNTNDNICENVASLKQVRSEAKCTIFKGKIVVVGGWGVNGTLNTVECYDHKAD